MKLSDLVVVLGLACQRDRLVTKLGQVEHDAFEVSISSHNLGPEAKVAVKQHLARHLALQLRDVEDRLEGLDVVVDG